MRKVSYFSLFLIYLMLFFIIFFVVDYLWWFLINFDNFWLFLIIFEYFVYFWIFLIVFDCFWLFLIIFDNMIILNNYYRFRLECESKFFIVKTQTKLASKTRSYHKSKENSLWFINSSFPFQVRNFSYFIQNYS